MMYSKAKNIDYVAGWYFKAAQFMQNTIIRTAFVSTNSITQGEQVAGVWKPLYDQFGIHIDFAHHTFRWDNRGKDEQGKKKNSKQKQANAASVTPYFFASPRQPKTDYLLIPIVSSERRRYIPIGYVSKDIIASNACFTIANANLFTLGIITSNVHMAWMRTVAGRLKSDYRYSNTIVYNNFPWCNPTSEQKAKIEQTAQAILDARAKYPECSLADLYDETTMPLELRKAHQANDFAVMAAYGFPKNITESECVAELMKMYQSLTK